MFKDRVEAGKHLAAALKKYKGSNAVVYALPRGGVVVGAEVAKRLGLELDLIIPRKIGHPQIPEYAIGAVAENGHSVLNKEEIQRVDADWLYEEIEKQKVEATRRRAIYLANKKPISAKNKIAIIVDDGIATGLTVQAAIQEIKHQNPKEVIVAVPVAPADIVQKLCTLADEVVVVNAPEEFYGAVGAYYINFEQVEDEDVVKIMRKK